MISEGDIVTHRTRQLGRGKVIEKAFDTWNRDWYVLVHWDGPGTTERAALGSVEKEEPDTIAYLLGSFWLCLEHGPLYPDADEQPAGCTMAWYEYRCDHPGCGKLIAAKEPNATAPRPEVHRWHLTVVFDEVPVQQANLIGYEFGGRPLLEHEAFYDWLAKHWGGLDEEFRQDVTLKRLSKGPVAVVARADTCEVLLQAMQWVGMQAVPRRMELNRNGDRD